MFGVIVLVGLVVLLPSPTIVGGCLCWLGGRQSELVFPFDQSPLGIPVAVGSMSAQDEFDDGSPPGFKDELRQLTRQQYGG